MTETEMRKRLWEESVNVNDVESDLSFAIFLVTKNTGANIDENYPLAKFHSLCEGLERYNKMKEKEIKKSNGRKSWR